MSAAGAFGLCSTSLRADGFTLVAPVGKGSALAVTALLEGGGRGRRREEGFRAEALGSLDGVLGAAADYESDQGVGSLESKSS